MNRKSQIYEYYEFVEGQEPPQHKNTFREKLFAITEDKTHSIWGKLYKGIMIVTILVGIATFLASTQPSIMINGNTPVLFWLEFCVVCFWTVDYLARLFCSPDWRLWAYEPLNICELVFICAFYAFLAVGPQTQNEHSSFINVIRILQTFRVFQIIRLWRYSVTLRLVIATAKKCKDAFLLLVVLVAMIVVVSSTMMFYAEQSVSYFDNQQNLWVRIPDNTISPFQSIPATMWWGIVTITTVGYGDTYPISAGGKVVASFTMAASLMALALPIGIFGAYFSEIWNAHVKQEQQEKTEREQKLKEKRQGGRMLSQFDTSWQLEKFSTELGDIILQLQKKQVLVNKLREKIKSIDENANQ